MNRIIKFIIIGSLFFTAGEVLLNIFVTQTYLQYLGTWIFYPLYLLFVYFSSKVIDRYIKRKVLVDLTYYFVYGFIGLMIEWSTLSHAPWVDPSANQIGMFAFWTGSAFMARIFIDERKELDRIKKSSLAYLLIYFVIIVVAGLTLPALSIGYYNGLFYLIWLFAIGYLLMNIFFIWYFIINIKTESKTSST
jgi:hypothetical protein